MIDWAPFVVPIFFLCGILFFSGYSIVAVRVHGVDVAPVRFRISRQSLMRIYLAGPLFNKSELERNVSLAHLLEDMGHEVYLPQRDGGVAYTLIEKGGSVQETRKLLFENDVKEIGRADTLLCILDGRVPDEGMCVELGIGYIQGKRCIGYCTDQRTLDIYGYNLMIEGCLDGIAHSEDDLKKLLT